ncbi:MAG: folylpolyglutamate synthase/dihydrofolate synthase family protein [Rikenellaceae bacterium]
MTYQETTEYLFNSMPSFQAVGEKGYKPGLERIEGFCKELGDPHLSYPTIHIAGTNGKGSSSHMLASILESAGYRVGLFTSPHLRDFRERIRISGEMICEDKVIEFVARHRERMEALSLSFFEMTAAMAFNHFARRGVDVAVIETGLGGRLDATNVVHPLLAIITNIGLEHTKYLGTTLEQIAREKCGIIKPGAPTIIGEHGRELDKIALELGEEVIFAEDHYTYINRVHTESGQRIRVASAERSFDVELDLAGVYQRHNLITVTAAIDRLNAMGTFKISTEAYLDGVAHAAERTSLLGRWQMLSKNPRIIGDTAHNTHGIAELCKQLSEEKFNSLYCVIGLANDKDINEILKLFPEGTHFIFTRAAVERAYPTASLAAAAELMQLKYECVDRVCDALDRAKELYKEGDLIFVGGSNFVISEII